MEKSQEVDQRSNDLTGKPKLKDNEYRRFE